MAWLERLQNEGNNPLLVSSIAHAGREEMGRGKVDKGAEEGMIGKGRGGTGIGRKS